MPALASVVTAYLTAIKTSLSTGSDLGSNIRGAALSYLRAQDMATVLDLLQDGMDSGTLTVVANGSGGTNSTTVLVDGVGTFVEGRHIGDTVTFASNTTTVALRSITRTVIANTHNTLTFDSALPGTPVAGDTYVLRGGMISSFISELRQDKALGDAPPGNVYGHARTAISALGRLVNRIGRVAATGTLTLAANAGNTQTVTIGSKTYTFQTVLTNVDGNVFIGATASDSIDNLIAAINLGAGAGTTYAAATTLHPTAYAAPGAGDTMIATAKTAGTAGNSIATTETLAAGGSQWAAATLLGGVAQGSFSARTVSWPSLQTSTGSTSSVIVLKTSVSGTFRIDELRGREVTISGETRRIDSNTESTLTLNAALTSAPAGDVAVSIFVPDLTSDSSRWRGAHPGRGDGENAVLSNLIGQAQTAVTNYVVPV